MKRRILSVFAGLTTAVLTFLISEMINARFYPTPSTLNFKDVKAVKLFYLNQPITLWLWVLIGWIIGSVLCGFLIKIISKSQIKKLPIIAGIILTLSAVANFYSLPHPTWFIIIGLLVFIPFTLIGHSLYKIKNNG